MRVDWQQELEGLSLQQIRDLLAPLPFADTPFGTKWIASRLMQAGERKKAAPSRAERLVRGLVASELIGVSPEDPTTFVLTDIGVQLRAAQARPRLKRARAEKAILRLFEIVQEINANPAYMHDVATVAVFGSYITEQPDLGDIDVAVELRARWTSSGKISDFDARQVTFRAAFPPPQSVLQNYADRLAWPEIYTKRVLRSADKQAMKILHLSELERLGCPYRRIYPDTADVEAKPNWSCARREIKLKPASN